MREAWQKPVEKFEAVYILFDIRMESFYDINSQQ